MDESFDSFVQRERARLNGEREAIFTQQQELEQRLEAVNREMQAIGAYEAAKSGKTLRATGGSGVGNGRRRSGGGRSGSKREALMQVIRDGNGLSRGEILEKMGLKGNKSGEMSVSNALTALTKGNQVRRDGGKYLVA